MLNLIGQAAAAVMNRRIPSTQPETSPQKVKEIEDKLQPGDVLMTSDLSYPGWGRMEYWAVNSHYSHAALLGTDNMVYEAVGEGVKKLPIAEFLEGRKKVAVARPTLSDQDKETATAFLADQIGKPYDTAFNYSSDDAFYCSELVAKALASTSARPTPPIEKVFGKDAVAPDVFLKMPGTQVVHDDKSHYLRNKIAYWPIALSAVGMGATGALVAGPLGALVGASAGLLGSVLTGNKIQTGQFSPSIAELRNGKH